MFFDIVVKMNTGIFKKGILMDDRKVIIKSTFKSILFLDLPSIISFVTLINSYERVKLKNSGHNYNFKID